MRGGQPGVEPDRLGEVPARLEPLLRVRHVPDRDGRQDQPGFPVGGPPVVPDAVSLDHPGADVPPEVEAAAGVPGHLVVGHQEVADPAHDDDPPACRAADGVPHQGHPFPALHEQADAVRPAHIEPLDMDVVPARDHDGRGHRPPGAEPGRGPAEGGARRDRERFVGGQLRCRDLDRASPAARQQAVQGGHRGPGEPVSRRVTRPAGRVAGEAGGDGPPAGFRGERLVRGQPEGPEPPHHLERVEAVPHLSVRHPLEGREGVPPEVVGGVHGAGRRGYG